MILSAEPTPATRAARGAPLTADPGGGIGRGIGRRSAAPVRIDAPCGALGRVKAAEPDVIPAQDG